MRNLASVAGLTIILLASTFSQAIADGHTNSEMIALRATLSAPNQNGTNSEYRTESLGVVPTSATGTFHAVLDVKTNTLRDIVLNVEGMKVADLKNFGPNATPFHIHLPNSGKQGDFGFNVVDLFYGSAEGSLADTSAGFQFSRKSLSILESDQGKYKAAGVHPGDDVIAQKLQNGYPFVLVHSNKNIFTNTTGKLPNGKSIPKGFPFGELRGEVNVVE